MGNKTTQYRKLALPEAVYLKFKNVMVVSEQNKDDILTPVLTPLDVAEHLNFYCVVFSDDKRHLKNPYKKNRLSYGYMIIIKPDQINPLGVKYSNYAQYWSIKDIKTKKLALSLSEKMSKYIIEHSNGESAFLVDAFFEYETHSME